MKIPTILKRPTNCIPLSCERFLYDRINFNTSDPDGYQSPEKAPVKSIFGNLTTGSLLKKETSGSHPFDKLPQKEGRNLIPNTDYFKSLKEPSDNYPLKDGPIPGIPPSNSLIQGVIQDDDIAASKNEVADQNTTSLMSSSLHTPVNLSHKALSPIKYMERRIAQPAHEDETHTDGSTDYSAHTIITPGSDISQGRYSHLTQYRSENVDSIIASGINVPERINLLIKERALRGLSSECLDILAEAKRRNVAVSTETYNNCLISCMKSNNAKLARYLFLCLRSELLTPDLRTYTLMIKTHVNSGDIASAFSMYRKMEKEGVKADLVVFSVLIDSLVEDRQISSAWRLFNYARTWRLIEPDEVLFTIMIKSCNFSNEAEKGLNLYHEMISLNLYPTIHTYTELIKCLSRRREYFNECFQFYNKIRSQEYPVTANIITHLLQSCCSVGNVRRARELLLEASNLKLKSTPEMYTIYIKTFARQMKNGNLTESEKINHIQRTWSIVKNLLSNYNRDWNKGSSNSASDDTTSSTVVAPTRVLPINTESTDNQPGSCEARTEVNTNPVNDNELDMKVADSIVNVNGAHYSIGNLTNSSISSPDPSGNLSEKDIVRLLNSVILVYENGDYYDYALEMLKCFERFNVKPDYMTYFILLRMVGTKMKDTGRFFALWSLAKSEITPQRTLLCMALDMAILSRSAKKTLEILNDMYNAKVFPTPALMKRLYESGKRITQIHLMINNLVTLQRKLTYEERLNEGKMLQTYIDENELKKTLDPLGKLRH